MLLHKLGILKEVKLKLGGIVFNVINSSDRYESKYITRENNEYTKYKKINKGDIVFDIGANSGGFSLFCVSKGAIVYAFEPNSIAFRGLKKNINGFINIHPIRKAISKRAGRKYLYYNSNNTWTNSLCQKEGKPKILLDNKEKVECITLDNALSITNGKCDFLKLDIEGEEFNVLPDSNLNGVKYIAVEYHSTWGDAEMLKRALMEKGFEVKNESPHENYGMLYCQKVRVM